MLKFQRLKRFKVKNSSRTDLEPTENRERKSVEISTFIAVKGAFKCGRVSDF